MDAVYFLAVGGTTATRGCRAGLLTAAVAQWTTPPWLVVTVRLAEVCGRTARLDGGLRRVRFLSVAPNVVLLPLTVAAVVAGKARRRDGGARR